MTQAWAMADLDTREARLTRLREPHVAPLNKFVDELRARHGGVIPYLDPACGGINARILFVLLRPGPRAAESGFLSIENHDLTARYMRQLLSEAKIPINAMAAWNIVPWYGPRKERVKSDEIVEGSNYLNGLVLLLPHLRSVVLVGRQAQSAAPLLKLPQGVLTFKAPHSSPSNLHTDPKQRAMILRGYRDAWAYAQIPEQSVTCADR